MKTTTTVLFALVALLALATPASADDALEHHPGYFPIEGLALLDTAQTEIEIDLKGSMLQLVAAATREDDPELSETVSELEAIRVLAGEPRDADLDQLLAEVDRAASELEAAGWQRIIKVREDDERVLVFARDVDGRLEGLTIIAVEGLDEVTMVNIVGHLDPATMGDVLDGLDVVRDVDLDVD